MEENSPFIIGKKEHTMLCHSTEAETYRILAEKKHQALFLVSEEEVCGHIKIEGRRLFVSYTNNHGLIQGGIYSINPKLRKSLGGDYAVSPFRKEKWIFSKIVLSHKEKFEVRLLRRMNYRHYFLNSGESQSNSKISNSYQEAGEDMFMKNITHTLEHHDIDNIHQFVNQHGILSKE